jgi:hypothetical protein
VAKTEKLLLEIQIKNQQALGKINRDITKLQASSFKLSTALKTAGTALAAVFAARLGKAIISTTARFEDLNDSLASVTGSAQAGAEAFDFVSKFATQTQFGVEDLTTTFIKLKASGIEPTQELLTLFTDTAAITTDQIGSLEAITDLFARTTSGGLGLEELNRLADRGVPVFRILEEQLGITRLEISEVGKTAEGSRKILNALSKGIRQDFGGATARVTDNLSTQFSNLQIALKNAANEAGKAMSPALKEVVADMTKFIEENEDTIEALGKLGGVVLQGAVKLFQALAIAVGKVVDFGGALNEMIQEAQEETKNLNNILDDPEGWDSYGYHINNTRGSLAKLIDPLEHAAALFGDDLGPSLTEAAEAQFEYNNALGDYAEDIGPTSAEVLKENADQKAAENRETAIMNRTYPKTAQGIRTVNKALNTYTDNLAKMLEDYSQAVIISDTLTSATMAFAKTTESALTDVIMGTKTLQEALGEIGQAIIRELIGGMIRLLVVGPILEKIAKIFGIDMVDGVLKQANAQAKLNTELKRTIGLKLLLMLLGGAADGGAIGYGNSKGKANGGAIGYRGARAMGGNVGTGGAYLVGERGPELFVPNTAGTVVSNESMAGRMGDTNINFNISTVDAAGFDELLLSRKNLIVGTIQQAFRQQGRRFA